jgi:hypothetical protein
MRYVAFVSAPEVLTNKINMQLTLIAVELLLMLYLFVGCLIAIRIFLDIAKMDIMHENPKLMQKNESRILIFACIHGFIWPFAYPSWNGTGREQTEKRFKEICES